MFDFVSDTASHMPFAAPDPNNGFAPREFCCLPINGKWKLHQFRNGIWQRIDTGFPDDMMECSPTAEFIDGVWHVSFVAGGSERSRLFKLYHISDLDAYNRPVVVCPASNGFIMKNRLVWAFRSGAITVTEPGVVRRILFNDAEYLYRVSYAPFHSGRLLVSGQTLNGEIFSRLVLLFEKSVFELFADGEVAYKACFWKDRCYYAKRTGSGFENRQITLAERYSFRRLNADAVMTIETETNSHRENPEEL